MGLGLRLTVWPLGKGWAGGSEAQSSFYSSLNVGCAHARATTPLGLPVNGPHSTVAYEKAPVYQQTQHLTTVRGQALGESSLAWWLPVPD